MAYDPACVGQVINIGPDDEMITINELARVTARILDFPLKPKYLEGRPQEVYLANCSADKARKILGYEPKVKLEEGLYQMIDYIQSRGARPFKYHLELEIQNAKTPETWSKRLF